jgi:hypothetical protein
VISRRDNGISGIGIFPIRVNCPDILVLSLPSETATAWGGFGEGVNNMGSLGAVKGRRFITVLSNK